jgi:hypothetical protein
MKLINKIEWLWWLSFGKRGVFINGRKMVEFEKALPQHYKTLYSGYGICLVDNHFLNGFGI